MKKLKLRLSLGAFLVFSLPVFLVGCSSSKKEEKKLKEVTHSTIKRDFEVRDASSNTRPGWIEDAEVWATSNEKKSKNISNTTEVR